MNLAFTAVNGSAAILLKSSRTVRRFLFASELLMVSISVVSEDRYEDAEPAELTRGREIATALTVTDWGSVNKAGVPEG